MSTASAKSPVRLPGAGHCAAAGRSAPGGNRPASVARTCGGSCMLCSCMLCRLLPLNNGQPEGMPWALLVLSWVLHQTPRYGDRCSPVCRLAPAATSGGLRLPRTVTLRFASTPARSGPGRALKSGTGRPMDQRSYGHCRGAAEACGLSNASRWPRRAWPAVWAFREPPPLTLAAGDGMRMPVLAACEKARGWHKAQALTWQISRAVIADRTGRPSGRRPRPGKDPS